MMKTITATTYFYLDFLESLLQRVPEPKIPEIPVFTCATEDHQAHLSSGDGEFLI